MHKYLLILNFARLLLEIQYGPTIKSIEADYNAIIQKKILDILFFTISQVLEKVSNNMYNNYLTIIEIYLD